MTCGTNNTAIWDRLVTRAISLDILERLSFTSESGFIKSGFDFLQEMDRMSGFIWRCACMCLLSVIVAHALMCQFPHCERVKCEPVGDCTNGTIKYGGGYCGCCKACFTTLEEGDQCEWNDGVDTILYPPTALCRYGLYCSHNTTLCEVSPFFG